MRSLITLLLCYFNLTTAIKRTHISKYHHGALPDNDDTVHSFDFNIAPKDVEISPGVTRSKVLVNGQFPGPLIRVPANAHVRVNVHNHLITNATSIHWHGLHQRGTPYYDGVVPVSQCPIPTSTSMVYDFHASPFGTSFWHAHFHSEAADGIYGPLITEEPEGLFPHFYDEERIIILSDHYDRTSWQEEIVNLEQIIASVKEGKQASDADPDRSLLCVYDESRSPATPSCSSTADGKGFNLNFQPGKTYRLRLICPAQVQAFLFSIDEHEMQIASLDMSPVDGGHWVKSVQLLTGQRVDVLVRAREGVEPGKKFWVRAEAQVGCDATEPSTVHDVRGIVTYGNRRSSTMPTSVSWNVTNPNCDELDYSVLRPVPDQLPFKQDDWEPALTLFVNYTFPAVVNGRPSILINNQLYNVSDNAVPTLWNIHNDPSWQPTTPGEQRNLIVIPDSVRGKQIRLIIKSNPSPHGGIHPFHAHGRLFKVVAMGKGEPTQADLDKVTPLDILHAVSRDTIGISRGSWVITQFTADNPGVWLLHCHIGWHLDAGMLAEIVELPEAIASEIRVPKGLVDMCRK